MHDYFTGKPLGLFAGHTDVGDVQSPGSLSFDPQTQTYVITGSRADTRHGRDAFHMAWVRLKGDFIVSARARFAGAGLQSRREIGWSVRTALAADSPHANVSLHGDGLAGLEFRRADESSAAEVRSAVNGPDVIQLERKGTTFLMSVARFGDPFSTTEIRDLDLGGEVFVGLYVCSHHDGGTEKAEFSNVRIVIPPREGFIPYTDYIGSDLEILEPAGGNRIAMCHATGSIQAPNWTPDGNDLIYNSNGRLFRFNLATRAVSAMNTEFATANNNDHVLSFDGAMIGISHHSSGDGGKSIVYTLPAGGGMPRKITALGPSYLHGWSPDGAYLVYTGERNGAFDIYRISADGGEEVRLTSTPGLDDGSEYAPDGRHVYFNSSRSGRMQIWRMKPDGGGQEQVTDDGFNNWVPHISPDGQQMVFLSFGPDVRPDDHPFYKQVYLRIMPVEGGSARVVAYVFGGQGTINVPSWSPDGQQIAFISNSDFDSSGSA